MYRRWVGALSLTIDTNTCRCGFDRDDGRHLSVAECSAFMAKTAKSPRDAKACVKPEEHHSFRRRLIPIKVERPYVW